MGDKKPINLHELRYKITKKFSAPKDKNKLQIGVDYIPPLSLTMSHKVGKKFSSSADKSAAASLPAEFSWNNDEQVKKYKGDEYVGRILTPGNQMLCGSCWAWAVTYAVSDRLAIKGKMENPKLGPSYLLACSVSGPCDRSSLAGCNGGVLDKALIDMSDKDITSGVSKTCWNYDWCAKNGGCSTDCADSSKCSGFQASSSLNSIIPDYNDNKNYCITSDEKMIKYQVVKNSVKKLTDIDSIKLSIFNNGPIPTGYYVFSDFMLNGFYNPSSDEKTNGIVPAWPQTDGVYIHLKCTNTDPANNYTWRTNNGDPPCYGNNESEFASSYNDPGGHAVVIVGWGVQKIKASKIFRNTYKDKEDMLDIPYWIVRNSWDNKWADKGFFRIAMTNPSLYINTTVHMDDNDDMGGAIDFDVDTTAYPSIVAMAGQSPNYPPSDTSSTVKYLIILVILLLLILLGYYIYSVYFGKNVKT